jgi:hypothetical protein
MFVFTQFIFPFISILQLSITRFLHIQIINLLKVKNLSPHRNHIPWKFILGIFSVNVKEIVHLSCPNHNVLIKVFFKYSKKVKLPTHLSIGPWRYVGEEEIFVTVTPDGTEYLTPHSGSSNHRITASSTNWIGVSESWSWQGGKQNPYYCQESNLSPSGCSKLLYWLCNCIHIFSQVHWLLTFLTHALKKEK